jgi:hypothetical protein
VRWALAAQDLPDRLGLAPARFLVVDTRRKTRSWRWLLTPVIK